MALLALALAAPAAAQDARAALREAAEKARAAHAAKDYPGFLQWSRAVAEQAPRSTRALYNLACAHALLRQVPEAVALLDRLTAMEVATGAGRDPDFDPIRERPEFVKVMDRARRLEARVGASEVAFTLPEADLFTEGVAHDAKSGAFFVSSVRKRKVVRREANGTVTAFTRPEDGLMAVAGLAVDAPRRALWLTTVGHPLMEGFRAEDENRSALVEYGVDDGRLRRRIAPPAGVAGALLSDLAVASNGAVFVADPASGRVYVLRSGEAELRVLVDGGPIGSAQGMAVTDDGRTLYVADYVQGIVRVDVETGKARLLPVPPDTAVTGIDGLVLDGATLVGIQNGIQPHRVVRLKLDAAGERITAVETLERHHPRFDEPTLGTRVGRDLFYVGNSQYPKVRPDQTFDEKTLQPPAILRLPLGGTR